MKNDAEATCEMGIPFESPTHARKIPRFPLQFGTEGLRAGLRFPFGQQRGKHREQQNGVVARPLVRPGVRAAMTGL
jgi:hypothetical protein